MDVSIAGGGVAGLLLARALRARGRSVLVANDPTRPAAGQAAVGLLNPVIGQRFTLAWQAPVAVPAARVAYAAIAKEASSALFRDVPVIRQFREASERAMWEARAGDLAAAGFRATEADADQLPAGIRPTPQGAVAIHGAGVVDAWRLLERLRKQLAAAGCLVEAACHVADLQVDATGVSWPSARVTAKQLVFAGGAADISPAGNVTQFAATGRGHALPVRPVKGETLLVQAPGIAPDAVVVSGHFLAPRGDGCWICGATQEPGASDSAPTAAAGAELGAFLDERLAVPWAEVDHRAGVHPVTPDMRPIVGRWVEDLPVYVLNGLGSRGLVLGPWLAETLAGHLVDGAPLPPEVAPARFAPVPPEAERWHVVDIARREALRRVLPGELVVDLTVGNGGDTLWLAEAVGAGGRVLGFDLQPAAVTAAKRRLAASDVDAGVTLLCANHAELGRHVRDTIGVAVANLGPLPGSDSPVSTQPASTLAAFDAVLERLRPGGALIAAVYVGYPGGREEAEAVAAWSSNLDRRSWDVCWHRHPARLHHAPSVLVVARRATR